MSLSTWEKYIARKTLDKNTLDSYRTVSHIEVLAKVIEMAATDRITEHLNIFTQKYQSACKPFHSTESALLYEWFHICNWKATDYSSSYPWLKHSIWHFRPFNINSQLPTSRFSCPDIALHWFNSYLYYRRDRVSMSCITSWPHTMDYGFPQGLIMGLHGYSIYMHPVCKMLLINYIGYYTVSMLMILKCMWYLILILLVHMMMLFAHYNRVWQTN